MSSSGSRTSGSLRDLTDRISNSLFRGVLSGAGFAAGACIIFAAGTGSSIAEFLNVLSVALALVAAASVAGLLLGLLFGMPREAEDSSDPRSTRFAFNSNLLKVSDWITTILVGLSLISLQRVPGAIDSFSKWVGPSLGGEGNGRIGVFLAILAGTAAFVLMYLWSTLVLRSHLETTARAWAESFSDEDLQKLVVGETPVSEEAKQLATEELRRRAVTSEG